MDRPTIFDRVMAKNAELRQGVLVLTGLYRSAEDHVDELQQKLETLTKKFVDEQGEAQSSIDLWKSMYQEACYLRDRARDDRGADEMAARVEQQSLALAIAGLRSATIGADEYANAYTLGFDTARRLAERLVRQSAESV